MAPGFVGKAKEKKQIIWERGLWRPGIVRSKPEAEIKRILLQDGVPRADDMYYDIVLAACPDFALEESALQAIVEARGHYLHLLHALPSRAYGRGHGVRLGSLKKIIQAKTREE